MSSAGRPGVAGTRPSPTITLISVGRHSLGPWLLNHLVTTVVLGAAQCQFQIGNVEIDPLSRLIAENAYLDLATVKLTAEQIRAITAESEIGGCVFMPVCWPPPALNPGEYVAFGGFPGSLRERPSYSEFVFPTWSSGASVVTSTTEDHFSCQFEREFWVASYGSEDHLDSRDLGGLNGGPAFIHPGLHWDFVGVMYEFSPEYDIMFFRPGHLISPDGLIQRPPV